MTWEAIPVPRDKVTAEFLYEIGKRHHLLPERVESAIDYYRAIAPSCIVFRVIDRQTKDYVAELIISEIVDGEAASVDFIPVPKFFSPINPDGTQNADPFHDRLNDALSPVLGRLIEGRRLRRLTAMVPHSRSRTCKALQACGFKREGKMRNAIKFRGHAPEDLVIMGLLTVKENGDGVLR